MEIILSIVIKLTGFYTLYLQSPTSKLSLSLSETSPREGGRFLASLVFLPWHLHVTVGLTACVKTGSNLAPWVSSFQTKDCTSTAKSKRALRVTPERGANRQRQVEPRPRRSSRLARCQGTYSLRLGEVLLQCRASALLGCQLLLIPLGWETFSQASLLSRLARC